MGSRVSNECRNRFGIARSCQAQMSYLDSLLFEPSPTEIGGWYPS